MKFLCSEEAGAEGMGQMLMIGITVIGVSMLSLLALPSINSIEEIISVQSVEQTFSQLDAEANQAILGELETMITDFNLGGGTLNVESGGESYITIKNENENNVIKIPMGKVTYRSGNRIVSYEGGGVWSKEASGETRMLSSPNFYFNGVSLTLPVISLNGEGSAGGKGTASLILRKNSTVVLYPDASIPNRTNPLTGSGTYVNVTSDFYDAWAGYARSIGYTAVTTNMTSRTASIRLSSMPATPGGNTHITNPITLRGLDSKSPEPVNNFSFRLVPYGKSFDWDIHAYSGMKRLIYHVKGEAKPDAPIDINVGYQDDGAGYNKPAETWEGYSKLRMQGQGDNLYLDLDLLVPDVKLAYNGINVGTSADKISKSSFNNSGFSWSNSSTAQITTKYKWFFNTSNESWISNFTTNVGTVATGVIDDGNPAKSLYAKLSNNYKTANVTWTSPNFTWTNGTPASASLYFDWKVATYATPGTFRVLLVMPDGSTSMIFPTTSFSASAGWSTQSNTTVSVNDL